MPLQQDDRQAKVCLLSPLYGNDDHHGDKVTAKPYLQRKYVHETRNVICILHDRIRLIFHTRYDGVKGEGERRWRTLSAHKPDDRVLNCRYQFSESHFLSTTLQSDKRGGEANRAPLYERIHTQDAKYKCQTSDQLRTNSSAGMVLSIAMYTKTIYCSTTIIILHTLVPE